MPKIGSGPILPDPPDRLRLRIPREELHKCSLESLIRLARFLGAPLYENLKPGLRKHHIVNAIERVEKSMQLGRKHPYKG